MESDRSPAAWLGNVSCLTSLACACSDMTSALQHLHHHQILHLDVKPENIFLHASGAFKLGDFGLAVHAHSAASWQEGDGRFVAPELLQRAADPGPAADVYSLGASVLHCAIGAHLVAHILLLILKEGIQGKHSLGSQGCQHANATRHNVVLKLSATACSLLIWLQT